MWQMLLNILLFSVGAIMGVTLMCLLQTGKEADKRMEKWRNEK